jgi:hypothetical protein
MEDWSKFIEAAHSILVFYVVWGSAYLVVRYYERRVAHAKENPR